MSIKWSSYKSHRILAIARHIGREFQAVKHLNRSSVYLFIPGLWSICICVLSKTDRIYIEIAHFCTFNLLLLHTNLISDQRIVPSTLQLCQYMTIKIEDGRWGGGKNGRKRCRSRITSSKEGERRVEKDWNWWGVQAKEYNHCWKNYVCMPVCGIIATRAKELLRDLCKLHQTPFGKNHPVWNCFNRRMTWGKKIHFLLFLSPPALELLLQFCKKEKKRHRVAWMSILWSWWCTYICVYFLYEILKSHVLWFGITWCLLI